jgi:hypothetical protein
MGRQRPGRRGVDQLWVTWAFHQFANNPKLTYGRLADLAVEEAARLGRDDAPSERTLRRLRRRWEALQELERAQYGYVYWPESFEAGLLPWEASKAVLELLVAHWDMGWARPTVRMAKWYWRITSILPNTNAGWRVMMARILAAIEASSQRQEDAWRQVERYLAYVLTDRGPKTFSLSFAPRNIEAIAEILRDIVSNQRLEEVAETLRHRAPSEVEAIEAMKALGEFLRPRTPLGEDHGHETQGPS